MARHNANKEPIRDERGDWIGTYYPAKGHCTAYGKCYIYVDRDEALTLCIAERDRIQERLQSGYYLDPANWPVNRNH